MSIEHGQLKTPEENYEDAALELALYRILKHENDMVRENASEHEEAETMRMADKSTQRMLELIEHHTKKKYRQKDFGRYGVRILKFAALAILIMNMGLTIAAATSTTVRTKAVDFLTEMNTHFMGIGFRENGLDIDVPENWEESYFPTYIPDGYILQSSYTFGGISEAEYAGPQGDDLLIEIYDITATVKINTEGAEITHTTIQGVNAIVLQQPYGEVDAIWAIGDCYFIVSSSDYKTTLAVAESMKLILK